MQIAHPHPPKAGKALELLPGLRWLRMPLPFALDHVNLWLLQDEGGWTAVDTGFDVDPIRAAWDQILSEHPLVRLLVTHFHPDHLGLASHLQARTGAPLWIPPQEYAFAQFYFHQVGGCSLAATAKAFRLHGLPEPELQVLQNLGNTYRIGVPELPETYHPIQPDQLISIGSRDWRMISGHGHSPEHASLYCEGLGILISGDMLLPRISTYIGHSPATPAADTLGRFLDSLERFRDLPADTLVLPSHGLPFRGIQTRIDQLRAHHAERCSVLLEACRRMPQSAYGLMPILFHRNIQDPHQTYFAMNEAIAHLVHLERRGEVVRQLVAGRIFFSA